MTNEPEASPGSSEPRQRRAKRGRRLSFTPAKAPAIAPVGALHRRLTDAPRWSSGWTVGRSSPERPPWTTTRLPARSRNSALRLASRKGSPALRFASTRGPPSSTSTSEMFSARPVQIHYRERAGSNDFSAHTKKFSPNQPSISRSSDLLIPRRLTGPRSPNLCQPFPRFFNSSSPSESSRPSPRTSLDPSFSSSVLLTPFPSCHDDTEQRRRQRSSECTRSRTAADEGEWMLLGPERDRHSMAAVGGHRAARLSAFLLNSLA